MTEAQAREVDRLARTLWDYHATQSEVKPSDFIVALGSHDTRVAEAAAALYNAGLAAWLVITGGYGKITRALWQVPEAVRFSHIATSLGVPEEKIIAETHAANIIENIDNTRAALQAKAITASSGIIVTKPYVQRRALATARMRWPSIVWYVTAPELTYETYADDDPAKTRMINLMVGNTQRMRIYATRGLQLPEPVPTSVWAAYEALVALGYDEYVLDE